MDGAGQRREPSSIEISRAYSRGVAGRKPLMLVPGPELYRQPLGAMTDAELLAAVQHNLKFAPCKRLCQQVIRRGVWEQSLRYPLLLEHARYFLEVVQRAPYHNQTDLNLECERIVTGGFADLISAKLAEAADAKLRFDMGCSIFRRAPDIHVPVTIWILPRKRRGEPDP